MKNKMSKLVLFMMGVLLCNTGWSGAEDKIKKFIDESANTLKGAVDQFGDDIAEIQSYFDHYQWKGIIENESTTDPVTLKNLRLNEHDKAVVVRPGERIQGSVDCQYASDKCSAFTYYRVILGIKDSGAQTTIGSTLGTFAGESRENFVLIAPPVKGVYQILFQPTEAFSETGALSKWRDPELTKPIGFIIVH